MSHTSPVSPLHATFPLWDPDHDVRSPEKLFLSDLIHQIMCYNFSYTILTSFPFSLLYTNYIYCDLSH